MRGYALVHWEPKELHGCHHNRRRAHRENRWLVVVEGPMIQEWSTLLQERRLRGAMARILMAS